MPVAAARGRREGCCRDKNPWLSGVAWWPGGLTRANAREFSRPNTASTARRAPAALRAAALDKGMTAVSHQSTTSSFAWSASSWIHDGWRQTLPLCQKPSSLERCFFVWNLPRLPSKRRAVMDRARSRRTVAEVRQHGGLDRLDPFRLLGVVGDAVFRAVGVRDEEGPLAVVAAAAPPPSSSLYFLPVVRESSALQASLRGSCARAFCVVWALRVVHALWRSREALSV